MPETPHYPTGSESRARDQNILSSILEKLKGKFGYDVDFQNGGILTPFDISTKKGFEKASGRMGGGNCREVAEMVAEALNELGISEIIVYTLSLPNEGESQLRYKDNQQAIDQVVSDTNPLRHVFVIWKDGDTFRVIDPTIIQHPIQEGQGVRLENISSPLEVYLRRFEIRGGKFNPEHHIEEIKREIR